MTNKNKYKYYNSKINKNWMINFEFKKNKM